MSSESLAPSPNSSPKPVEIVYDEERIRILIDDTRKGILAALSEVEGDMSVTEIAEHLRTNPQRIYHHVDKLVENNFLVKTREERKKRSITSYYARTAQAFIVSYSTNRGYIHAQELSNHFIDNFKTILGLDLNPEEEMELSKLIGKLAQLSEHIFLKFSNQSQEDVQRHHVENLYFLLEYLIFFSNLEARPLLTKFIDIVQSKIITSKNGIKTIRI